MYSPWDSYTAFGDLREGGPFAWCYFKNDDIRSACMYVFVALEAHRDQIRKSVRAAVTSERKPMVELQPVLPTGPAQLALPVIAI